MKTKVLRLDIDINRRIIVISDIHGNLSLFKSLLDKIKFNNDDYLFIDGDIIEKSNTNILMLDYIMALSEKPNVYVLCGNCDDVMLHLIPPVDENLIRFYALKRPKTIINEFAGLLNVKIDDSTNINDLCKDFYQNFRKYFDFIESLPHLAILNDKLAICHGGIDDLDNISEEAIDLMKYDDFYSRDIKLKMPLIVGHFPTINYDEKIPSISPVIDLNKNIISIDGGNNLVPWSMLNALIISNLKDFKISYDYQDEYKKIRVKEDNINNVTDLYNITKKPIFIDLLEEIGDYFLVKTNDNHKLYILKENIIYSKEFDRTMAYNGFNYFIDVKKGDLVSLVFKRKPYSIVKKDGIIGLIDSNKLDWSFYE